MEMIGAPIDLHLCPRSNSATDTHSSCLLGGTLPKPSASEMATAKCAVEAAEQCYRSWLDRMPTDIDALIHFGKFLATKGGFERLQEAQRHLERAAALDPHDSNARTLACVVLRERGLVLTLLSLPTFRQQQDSFNPNVYGCFCT